MKLSTLQQKLALTLFDIGAVKFGAFKLKLHETHPDAPLSPIYLNLRTKSNPKPGPLGEPEIRLAAHELLSLARTDELQYDLVSGVPNAGDPFAEMLCRLDAGQGRSLGFLVLSKSGDADRRMVTSLKQGAYRQGDIVLVVDDLITRADSKFEAIHALEKAKLLVRDVLVLVDREQGGKEELARAGYKLHSVFTLATLLDFYAEAGKISNEKRDEIKVYLRENS